MGNHVYRTPRNFILVFLERLVQVVWYIIWIILLMKKKTKLPRQV